MTTAHLALPGRDCETATVWIRLAATTGWDVRTGQGSHSEVIAHFEDWHRLERTMARLGRHELSIDTEIPDPR